MVLYYIKFNKKQEKYILSNSRYNNIHEQQYSVEKSFKDAINIINELQPESNFQNSVYSPDIIYYTYTHINYDVNFHRRNKYNIMSFAFYKNKLDINKTFCYEKYSDFIEIGFHEINAILMSIHHAQKNNYTNIEIKYYQNHAIDLLTSKVKPTSTTEKLYIQELNNFCKNHNIVFTKNNPYEITCENDVTFNKKIIMYQHKGLLKGSLPCL